MFSQINCCKRIKKFFREIWEKAKKKGKGDLLETRKAIEEGKRGRPVKKGY